ncbi:MAG: CRISPR-associated protein Cas4 [Oscillospiraceae bacterium]
MSGVSGLIFEYYHICKRKAWYASNGISMEQTNDNVMIGKLIDETSYDRQHKHILVDEGANIDFMKDKTVYEVKKSTAEKQASLAQIKYYLYVLKKKGVLCNGELRVPKENYVQEVFLTDKDEEEIEEVIKGINEMIQSPTPPKTEKMKICKNCAFYDLCYI